MIMTFVATVPNEPFPNAQTEYVVRASGSGLARWRRIFRGITVYGISINCARSCSRSVSYSIISIIYLDRRRGRSGAGRAPRCSRAARLPNAEALDRERTSFVVREFVTIVAPVRRPRRPTHRTGSTALTAIRGRPAPACPAHRSHRPPHTHTPAGLRSPVYHYLRSPDAAFAWRMPKGCRPAPTAKRDSRPQGHIRTAHAASRPALIHSADRR